MPINLRACTKTGRARKAFFLGTVSGMERLLDDLYLLSFSEEVPPTAEVSHSTCGYFQSEYITWMTRQD